MSSAARPQEAERPLRVVIADDHPLFRAGVRARLERDGSGIEVVAEAPDGLQACELVARHRPDVVVLDVAMPELNGIEATRRIKAEQPEVGILVLTLYDDEQYVDALLDAGAAGYLLKTTDGAELPAAVRRIHDGEAVLAPEVTEKALRRLVRSRTGGAAPSPLTDREREVLRLAARGDSNKAIASGLCLSVRTVHAHMRNIFGKLGVASRTEAVMAGVRQGWLEVGEEA